MNMKKRLLIFHPTIAPYRIDFFNSLNEAFDTRVCLTWNDEKTFDYTQIYSQLNFNPSFISDWLKIGKRTINKGFWRQIDEYLPDIVIVPEFGICTIIVLLHRWLKRSKFKIVALCDDSYNMLTENNDFSIFHSWAKKIISPRMDDLILVEPQARDWYQSRINKGFYFPIIRSDDKLREVFKRVLVVSNKLLREYHLEDKNVFLFVGRFVALKNLNRLIEAFSYLNQHENVLVLVGNGEEEQQLHETAIEFGVKPLFTGRLEGEDLYAWYNVADYFVLASLQEAFGAVTNEALLAGCYALVSQRAGSHCLIEEGKNGFVFNPVDVVDLCHKMEEAIVMFPRKRPLDQVKKNLMKDKYADAINGLIKHLNKL